MSLQWTTFFSYSRTDSEFTARLAQDLRSADHDIWLDQLDIAAGERWDDSIQRALSSSERLLVILSPASASSQNVMDEVSFALEEGRQVIPVLYQACEIPFRLRRLQHIDFTQGYEEGLAKLRRALQSATSIADAERRSTATTASAMKTTAPSATSSSRRLPRTWLLAAGLAVPALVIVAVFMLQGPTPPTANFTAAPTSGTPPLAVTFIDRSTGDIDEIRWEFGDGTMSQYESPQHTFTAAGEYPVRLTIKGPGGDDSQVTVIKVASPPAAPVSGSVTQQTKGHSSPAVANVQGNVTINVEGGKSKD